MESGRIDLAVSAKVTLCPTDPLVCIVVILAASAWLVVRRHLITYPFGDLNYLPPPNYAVWNDPSPPLLLLSTELPHAMERLLL